MNFGIESGMVCLPIMSQHKQIFIYFLLGWCGICRDVILEVLWHFVSLYNEKLGYFLRDNFMLMFVLCNYLLSGILERFGFFWKSGHFALGVVANIFFFHFPQKICLCYLNLKYQLPFSVIDLKIQISIIFGGGGGGCVSIYFYL